MLQPDTIAALSSAVGISAVALIRISGPDAHKVWTRFVRTSPQSDQPPSPGPRMLVRAFWVAEARAVDEIMAVRFNAPDSYTGEDMLEIHAHGGAANVRIILAQLFDSGVRPAESGEFTLRAFANGKMTLPQAEAVMDIIHAPSEAALDNAVRLRGNALLTQIAPVRRALVDLLARVEVAIDYPEDGHDDLERPQAAAELSSIQKRLEALASGYHAGRVLQEGLKVVLVGRPNVGKSSILNRILGRERVIVDHEPGTTRDLVSETTIIHKCPFTFFDTAGLRSTRDRIESRGVEITRIALDEADMALLVLDASQGITAEDRAILGRIGNRLCVVANNKIDIGSPISTDALGLAAENQNLIEISALTGQGFDALYQILIEKHAQTTTTIARETLITNLRQHRELMAAAEYMASGRAALEQGLAVDAVAADLHLGLGRLAAVEGLDLSGAVLDAVFSQFCVGK